jgi:hypothetical protein
VTDVLKLLPPVSWRGIKYPVTARNVSFRHQGATHTIQYRDFDFIEQLGAHDLTFSYTLPMREDIARGPYKNLFTTGLAQLLRDSLNRDAAELEDPVYGVFRCVPNAFNDDLDVTKRCGTDVKVEFRFSPDFTDQDPEVVRDIAGVSGLVTDAGALDQEVARADWKQEPTPEPMVDPIQFATGVGQQSLAQINKVSSQLDDLALKLDNLEKTCDLAENPQNWQIRNSSRRMRESTIRLNKRLSEDPAVKLKRITTSSVVLLASLAKDVGMTLEALLKLNPALARLPFVPSGTTVYTR